MADKNYLHTAYADSADGTDGFTTVYPNLNLLSQNDLIPGYLNDKWVLIPPSTGVNERTSPFLEVDASQSYTAQVFVTLAIQRSSWCGISWFDQNQIFIKRTAFQESNVPTSGNYTYHYTVQPPSNAKFVRISFRQWGDGKLKLEPGSTATPYMPSATEVTTADWPKFVGTYVDTNPVSSTDLSKYDWDEMKYRVYLDGIAVGGSKLLSFDLENLKADTTYNVQVNQINGTDESDKSESVAFKTTLTN